MDDQALFDVLAFGRFDPTGVRFTYDPAPRPTTPRLDAVIDATWNEQTRLARAADRMLFNGEMLRYVSHAVTAAGGKPVFNLTVGPTCYRDFVGTNLFGRDRLNEFGWRQFANPIGTTATVLTSDGRICYGRRSARVSYHARHVHTFGGALEQADRAASGEVDAFASVRRELWEELGLVHEDILDMPCAGLIRDREIHQPEMLFEASLCLTAAQVVDRWRSAPSRDEHDEIVTLEDRADAIVPFIESCGPIAPVAVGALLLYGRRRWGEPWYRSALPQVRAGRQAPPDASA